MPLVKRHMFVKAVSKDSSMDPRLKDIVATYINVPAEQITADTVIDRSSVSSSIVLHRMYAKLADSGFKVDNYWNIKTFGSLLNQNNGNAAVNGSAIAPESSFAGGVQSSQVEGVLSTGIDIEEIDAMPRVDDFREHAFYSMNFAPAEISYCILQPNPYASFAGLFALKEAIVKCENRFKGREFKTIVVDHNTSGKPTFERLQVSISHTESYAVAIAIKFNVAALPQPVVTPAINEVVQPVSKPAGNTVAWFAILIALFSIALTIYYINQL